MIELLGFRLRQSCFHPCIWRNSSRVLSFPWDDREEYLDCKCWCFRERLDILRSYRKKEWVFGWHIAYYGKGKHTFAIQSNRFGCSHWTKFQRIRLKAGIQNHADWNSRSILRWKVVDTILGPGSLLLMKNSMLLTMHSTTAKEPVHFTLWSQSKTWI